MSVKSPLRCPKKTPAVVFAARAGDLASIKKLFARGARLDQSDADGVTPLIAAAYAGHILVLEYLLTNGADTTVRDCSGYTALGNASVSGNYAAIAILLRYAPKEPLLDPMPLLIAALYGHAAAVHCLLQAGAPVDASHNGLSPLWAALANRNRTIPYARFESDRPGVMRLLLEYGADAHLRNAQGKTPEEYAADNYPETLVLLCAASERQILAGAASLPLSPHPSSSAHRRAL